MRPLTLLAAAAVTTATVLGSAGCPHCIDDKDDAFEDNDTADDATQLDADTRLSGVVADCDADFFSAGALAGDVLHIVFAGHGASITDGLDFSSSGALHIEVSRDDRSIPIDVAEGEGEADPTHAQATVTADDDGVTNTIDIDVPAADHDGPVIVEVVKDGYADNVVPVSDTYDLSARPQ